MGKNFFQSILPYLAGAAGSGISSQFSALAPYSAAIGAGAGALSDMKNPLGGAAAGFAGGGVGSTLAGGIKGAFNTPTGGSALDSFGSGAMSGLKSFGNSIPGFGGVGTSNPTGAFAKFFAGSPSTAGGGGGSSVFNSNTTTGLGTLGLGSSGGGFTPMASGYSATTPSNIDFSPLHSGLDVQQPGFTGSSPLNFGSSSAAGGSPSGAVATNASSQSAGGPMSMFKSLIPGAAVSLMGGAMAPKVAAPDYSGVMAQFKQQMETGGDPVAKQAAENQYLATLAKPDGASAEGAVANANLINERQKAAANKAITEQFSANNGSTTGNSAYNDAITKSNAAYDANYQAQAQQAQFQADQLQQQQKLASATALQGRSDTQLQYYAGLAGLSIEQIREKTGMDVANSQAIKNIATAAGTLLMQKGLQGVK